MIQISRVSYDRKMIGQAWENDRKMMVEWDFMGFTTLDLGKLE